MVSLIQSSNFLTLVSIMTSLVYSIVSLILFYLSSRIIQQPLILKKLWQVSINCLFPPLLVCLLLWYYLPMLPACLLLLRYPFPLPERWYLDVLMSISIYLLTISLNMERYSLARVTWLDIDNSIISLSTPVSFMGATVGVLGFFIILTNFVTTSGRNTGWPFEGWKKPVKTRKR